MTAIKKFPKILFIALLLNMTLFTISSCNDDDPVEVIAEDEENEEEVIVDSDFEATDWTEATHSKSTDPNFAEVFEDNTIKRIDIVITEARWQSMLDDMTDLYGTFGANRGGGPGGLDEVDEDPIFVPAEVYYNGIEWYRVGVRFKGNSSLQTSWQRGVLKLAHLRWSIQYQYHASTIRNVCIPDPTTCSC